MVSFIITTYNLPSEYLELCLKSILKLSLNPKEREIIIIDDGSELSPIHDLMDYQDDFIYLRQRNQGLSIARNTGIKVATGRFLQFIDGDDYLLQTGYEHCLDLVRYHDPDIVYFSLTDKEIKEVPYSYSEPVSGSAFLHNNNLRGSACSYVFRRDILQNQRFTPGILHEDEEFTPLLFLKAERVITTDARAYFYRTRKDSIMHQKENIRHNLKRLADTELVICHLQEKAALLSETERVALKRRIAQHHPAYSQYPPSGRCHEATARQGALSVARQKIYQEVSTVLQGYKKQNGQKTHDHDASSTERIETGGQFIFLRIIKYENSTHGRIQQRTCHSCRRTSQAGT